MSDEKMSPSPWTWSVTEALHGSLRWQLRCGRDERGANLIVVSSAVPPTEVDARLIASAPELLEMLRALVEENNTFLAMLREARALIARIDGAK